MIEQRGCESRMFLFQGTRVKQILGFTQNVTKIVNKGKLTITYYCHNIFLRNRSLHRGEEF